MALTQSPCKSVPPNVALTVGGMHSNNRGCKPSGGPLAKKVAPPTVPDVGGGSSSSSSTCSSHRHSGSSLSSGVFSSTTDQRSSFTSSLGEDSNPPPSPRSPGRDSGCDQGTLTSTGSICSSTSSNCSTTRLGSISSVSSTSSPSHYQNSSQQFTFPSTNNHQVPHFVHLMCPKASPGSPQHATPDTNYTYLQYQQQGSTEDQGIDVQSPGRSSPGSGSGSSTTGSTASSGNCCGNSTTSLDSGRASSSTHTGTHTNHSNHRLSGQSYDSGSIRNSYHSSSSSIGSTETEGGSAAHVNVYELMKNGVPYSEVLRVWLCELHFEEYYDKFLSAGYDMPTISRMTPEDLNAIGITKPAHRKKLKAEISRLNISDGLPVYIPSRLEEWLQLLRLDNYTTSLKQQNYNTVDQFSQITWEDLEDVGITKLGHQKKIMLAIKRVKDIKSGKKFYPVIPYTTGQEILMRENGEQQQCYMSLSYQYPHNHPTSRYPPHYPPGIYHHNHPSDPQRQSTVLSTNPTALHYRPDLVAVNIRQMGGNNNNIVRGRSHEPIYGTYQTFVPDQQRGGGILPPKNLPLQNGPQRSFDDGDITPTNEMGSNSCFYEGGGGTLPRPRGGNNKYRPVAKVTATKTRADIHEIPKFAKDKKLILPTEDEKTKLLITPQGTPKKKLPPPPPRRSNSISEGGNNKNKDSLRCNAQHNTNSLRRVAQKNENSLCRGQKNGDFLLSGQPNKNSLSLGQQQHTDSLRIGGQQTGDSSRLDGQQQHTDSLRRVQQKIASSYELKNLQPDVASDMPPPPPAPQDSGNHQHLMGGFPPPPPPLTCLTLTKRTSELTNTTSSSVDYNSDSETGGFRTRRNESNSSFKSNSSSDSGESLPFANDNAGTIKQRTGAATTSIVGTTTTRPPHPTSVGGSPAFNHLVSSSPRSSPLASPAAMRRKEGVVRPTLRQPPETQLNNYQNSSPEPAKNNIIDSPEGTSDVLSDIGNMLANLTDELDAMLEQELANKQ